MFFDKYLSLHKKITTNLDISYFKSVYLATGLHDLSSGLFLLAFIHLYLSSNLNYLATKGGNLSTNKFF